MHQKNNAEEIPPRKHSLRLLYFYIIILSVLNTGFSIINDDLLSSPIFLDSIFTIAGGMFLGPLPGLATGLLTHIILFALKGGAAVYLQFAPCSMLTGLIIGLMARKGKFDNAMHLMPAVMLLALIISLLGSGIALVVYGGYTRSGIDHITATLYDSGLPLIPAVLLTAFITNIIDKMICVYTAFGLGLFHCYIRRKALNCINPD
jgi:energy-coupling factor transport system substrate-specific component